MNFELTDEQEMLSAAARDALGRQDTLAAARAAADGADPLDLWPVAVEAGWAGLLIAEERGGAGLGLFDAMLVLEQAGRRLATTGLIGHLPATLVLERAAAAGDAEASAVLGDLASGERRAAILHAAPPIGATGWTVDAPGSGLRASVPVASEGKLSGEAGYVPDAGTADVLVVPALDQGGALLAYLVEAGAEGVEIESLVRFDATRPLAHVRLTDAPGVALQASADDVAESWHLAQALLAAEALGAADAVREMAVAYAKDRHAFGRPIGSYQAVKHLLVEMLRAAATARSLTYYAALAAETEPEDLARATSCVRFAAERAAEFSTRTCIAVHGGIGVTWEHDAPFYWRRAQLSRLLVGGGAGAADRVAEEVIAAARRRAEAA